MTRKQLDTMREVCLWVGQMIVPGVTLGASLMAIPEVRNTVYWKAQQMKYSIRDKKEKIQKKFGKGSNRALFSFLSPTVLNFSLFVPGFDGKR